MSFLLLLLISYGFSFDKMHGHKSQVVKLNYDSLFNTAVQIEKSEKAQTLINGCFDAYGGEKHLNTLNSFKIVYEMKTFASKTTIQAVKSFQRGRKYKVVVDKDPNQQTRILNQELSWYIGKDTLIELYSGRYKAELFSYLTLSMPLGIKSESFNEIRYGQRNDDSLSYLYMKKNDSLLIIIGIDTEDYFIKKSEGIIYQDTASFIFINRFDEFDTFEGFVFPQKLTNISMGLEIARSAITDIEINLDFTDNDFKPMIKKKVNLSD